MNPLQRETLEAFLDLQIASLWNGATGADDPAAVLLDAEAFLQSIPETMKRGLNLGLTAINGQAILRHRRQFSRLSLNDRRDVLDVFRHGMLSFGVVSLVSTLGWLVIHSREAARRLVGFTANDAPAVDLREPPLPSLSTHYDLCIIGSGAGGSVVAAVAAAAWRGTAKRILIIDAGRWISPANLSRRDDTAVRQLYKDAGLQIAAGGQDIDILQAEVVGGGPYINNAIHLPIRPAKWQQWRDEHAFPIPWARLESALTVVEQELHLNVDAVTQQQGWRSALFQRGAQGLNLDPRPFPMAIEPSICVGHGACNMGCPIGAHTGGLHRVAPTNNASYFMRAIDKGALVHSQLRAESFDVGRRSIRGVHVQDLRNNRPITIRAREYVLAAGPIASSRVLQASGLGGPEVGRRIAANVVTPVYAKFAGAPATAAEPGIPMCYYVDRGGHLLQNWFHYPASLSLSPCPVYMTTMPR